MQGSKRRRMWGPPGFQGQDMAPPLQENKHERLSWAEGNQEPACEQRLKNLVDHLLTRAGKMKIPQEGILSQASSNYNIPSIIMRQESGESRRSAFGLRGSRD